MNEFFGKDTTIASTPLGAGDLIDRAVRFYRGNFWTFVWIAAPPVIVGTIVSVGWTLLGRRIFSVATARNADEIFGYYLFIWFGGLLIRLIEMIATLAVMGGAARNFVRHLLFGEPVTFRETYKNTARRLGSLVAASTIIIVLLGFVGFIVFCFGIFFGALAVTTAFAAFSFAPTAAFVVSLGLSLGTAAGALWLFFLAASRFAYVPQVMLVEGAGVFSAFGRSASLASGNVKRLAGLFIFTVVAAYSALALLYVPLNWYAWATGVEIFTFNSDVVPAWYEIANEFIGQAGLILLMPIWMIGLCLLYIDERVRHEGYDIELMAARRLGEIPDVPREFVNPLQPALADRKKLSEQPARQKNDSTTTLGLK